MPGKEVTEDDLKNMSPEEIAELQKQNCIFCRIANKEIPAKIIHEDADVMCILDINPASEGHILVYPKKHYMIMPHMPEDILKKIFKNVKLMSHTLLKSLQCKGTTIFIANGAAAGQKAPHVLVHVFPRRENDGLVNLPNYELSEEQLEKLHSEIGLYISKVFGRKKPIVKTAEFSEIPKNSLIQKQKTVMEVEDTENSEDDSETSENEIDTKEDSEEENDNAEFESKEEDNKKSKKETTKKNPHKKKQASNEEDKSEDKKNNNIDLDDISRLFG
ncbi:MAG: HIT family protein [Candidatus Woesearchaeota archaeon]